MKRKEVLAFAYLSGIISCAITAAIWAAVVEQADILGCLVVSGIATIWAGGAMFILIALIGVIWWGIDKTRVRH